MNGSTTWGGWQTIVWREAGIRLHLPPTLAQLPEFSDVREHLAFGATPTQSDVFEALDLYFQPAFKDGDTAHRWSAWLNWLASTSQWQSLIANLPVGYKMGNHFGYRGSFRYTAKMGAEVVGALVIMQVRDINIVICYRCATSRVAALGEVMNALLATVDFRVMPPTGKWVRAIASLGTQVFLSIFLLWDIGQLALWFFPNFWINGPIFAFFATLIFLWDTRLIGRPLADFKAMQARRHAVKERDSLALAEPQGSMAMPIVAPTSVTTVR